MASKRKHIIQGFEIPWQVAAQIFREKKIYQFNAWRRIRLECGPSFMKVPEGIDPRRIKQLLDDAWLRRDGKTGRYYQVPISKIFEFNDGQYKVFHPARWAKIDCATILFHIVQSYFTKFHGAAATLMQESLTLNPRGKGHLGGMALTKAMEELDISLGTAHNYRERCVAAGLCKYEKRYKVRKYEAAQEA